MNDLEIILLLKINLVCFISFQKLRLPETGKVNLMSSGLTNSRYHCGHGYDQATSCSE